MSNDTAAHVDKSTLVVSVYDPEHAARVTTALFTRTRDEVLASEPLCWLCGCPKESVGPLELHHCNVERMFAEITDYELLRDAALAGELGFTPKQRELNRTWDWVSFLASLQIDPLRCYDYVDNMHLNGLPLCKPHHTGTDEGIHNMDFPRWQAQRYAKGGWKFSDAETIDSEAQRVQAIGEDEGPVSGIPAAEGMTDPVADAIAASVKANPTETEIADPALVGDAEPLAPKN